MYGGKEDAKSHSAHWGCIQQERGPGDRNEEH